VVDKGFLKEESEFNCKANMLNWCLMSQGFLNFFWSEKIMLDSHTKPYNIEHGGLFMVFKLITKQLHGAETFLRS